MLVSISIVNKETVADLLKKILLLVSDQKNTSAAVFWIRILQKQGVEIIENTKDPMGKSPSLEALRRMIERGPSALYLDEITQIYTNPVKTG